MHLKFSIISKLTMLVAGLVVITALAVNQIYLHGSNQILVEEAITNLKRETEFFKYPLDGVLRQFRDDAQLLAGTPPGANMASLFEQMLRTRPYYKDIRYRSASNEALNFERSGPVIKRVQAESAEPSAFDAALRLKPGEVYFTRPGLERKDGKVTTPHTLLLAGSARAGASGAVTISLDLGQALNDIRQELLLHRTLYITDSSGDYLLAPDASKLYGGDLGHDSRIQRDYPKVLEPMNDTSLDTAAFLSEETENGRALAFLEDHYDPLRPEEYLGISIEAPYRDIVAKTALVERRGFFFSLLIACAGVAAAIFALRLMIRPLGRIANAVVRYRKGEKDIALPVDSPDEVGVLAREFGAMMQQKDNEDWVKENLVAIAKTLLGFKDLERFAGALIAALVQSSGAQLGTVYISSRHMRRSPGHDVGAFVLAGTYGVRNSKALPQEIPPGTGLAGRCAMDKSVLVLSNIGQSLSIATTLFEAKPEHVLLIPILFENDAIGVMEIASMHAFTAVHRALFEQIDFTIGVIINSISAGLRTEELLEEARMTAEELQRSEEELKVQQEELQASNEEMEENTKALEEQNLRIRRQSVELTESKRVIEEKAHELTLSNQYKSEFLANMSHELRTPLNSLLILSKSLAANEDGNLTEEQIEEAGVIHSGGLELLKLINDILDLSKVEAGKIDIISEDVFITTLIRKMERQFAAVAKEAGLRFTVKPGTDLPASLHTDMQRVEQILRNLLSNAFKFTEKGSVTLEIEPQPEGRIAFKVTDTGIGIAPDKLKDIFEAFQQENGAIDRHYGGTGLGLTIARRFAHLLGGEIRVVSEKNKGSAFTLLLPVAGAAEKERPAEEPRIAVPELPPMQEQGDKGVQEKRLLIIEDNEGFAETLARIARRRGYRAIVAKTGKNGLLLAATEQVSAILLDLSLPDISGMEVLDRIKNDLKTRHIPVHVISGAEAGAKMLTLSKGAVGYLRKPVQEQDMDAVFLALEQTFESVMKEVLVVEDDKNTQTAIARLLRKKDVNIVFCGTGAAALEKIKATHFDCIILDLQLPDMTGFEWLQALKEEREDAAGTPAVIYTARELSEDENRRLAELTSSIVIKGASSQERLLDEVTLFLHSVESSFSHDQLDMIRMQHNPDRMLEGRAVLLVDDDLRNTFALSKLLKKRGMRVIIADNGKMALEKLEQESGVELVIMDIMMPVMDGYQAMREIRKQARWKNLPVLALTARAMPQEQEKCMEAGANDYLSKPVDVDKLLALLRVWLFTQEKAA